MILNVSFKAHEVFDTAVSGSRSQKTKLLLISAEWDDQQAIRVLIMRFTTFFFEFYQFCSPDLALSVCQSGLNPCKSLISGKVYALLLESVGHKSQVVVLS